METALRIVYLQDTLCGWCYGFSPQVQQLQQHYSGVVPIDVVAGGMIRGSRVGTIADVAPYIKTAYRRVEETTGVRFGEPFLENLHAEASLVLDSVVPARAIVTAKRIAQEHVLNISHDLQAAIYRDGLDITQEKTYRFVVNRYGINTDIFLQEMFSDEVTAGVEEEFALTEALGVTGFPTVIALAGYEGWMVAQGFDTAENMIPRIDAVLRETGA
ncbi:MAG TPA: DsbA family protein [Bacteroidetes bacterium]|nr:DsbA family protein [Bacteroidota bacterium]HRK04559.1 DsbA family protein [Chlorobiota bacterium]